MNLKAIVGVPPSHGEAVRRYHDDPVFRAIVDTVATRNGGHPDDVFRHYRGRSVAVDAAAIGVFDHDFPDATRIRYVPMANDRFDTNQDDDESIPVQGHGDVDPTRAFGRWIDAPVSAYAHHDVPDDVTDAIDAALSDDERDAVDALVDQRKSGKIDPAEFEGRLAGAVSDPGVANAIAATVAFAEGRLNPRDFDAVIDRTGVADRSVVGIDADVGGSSYTRQSVGHGPEPGATTTQPHGFTWNNPTVRRAVVGFLILLLIFAVSIVVL